MPRARKASAYLAEHLPPLILEARELAAAFPHSADAESLHNLRVALRRVRAALRTARGVYSAVHLKAISRGLRRVADLGNQARDAEVLIPMLRALPADEELRVETNLWTAELELRGEKARARLGEAIAQGRLAQPLDWLDALLKLPVDPNRDESARSWAARVAAHRMKLLRLGLAQLSPTLDDPATAHAARLAAKQVRYALDFLDDLTPKRFQAVRKNARDLQAALGDLHDLDVLLALIRRHWEIPGEARRAMRSWARERRAEQAIIARKLVNSCQKSLPA